MDIFGNRMPLMKDVSFLKIVDSSVYAPSFMDFVVPSNFAKRALYYALQFGHYHCDEQL